MTFSPPSDPASRERARQRLILKIVIGCVALGSVLLVVMATVLPLAARLFIAATDLAVAAVLALVLRQKFR